MAVASSCVGRTPPALYADDPLQSQMKRTLATLLAICPLIAQAQNAEPVVVTSDIGRFWQAFDAVSSAPDSAAQYRLLGELFIEPGTPGLHALMERRGYTPEDYVTSITDAPCFGRRSARTRPALTTTPVRSSRRSGGSARSIPPSDPPGSTSRSAR